MVRPSKPVTAAPASRSPATNGSRRVRLKVQPGRCWGTLTMSRGRLSTLSGRLPQAPGQQAESGAPVRVRLLLLYKSPIFSDQGILASVLRLRAAAAS